MTHLSTNGDNMSVYGFIWVAQTEVINQLLTKGAKVVFATNYGRCKE